MLIQPPCSGDYAVDEISGDDERIESKLLCDIFEDYVANKLDVPTLPDIALRVREAVDDVDANVPELPVLFPATHRLPGGWFRLLTAPPYRGVSSAESCRDAIVRLGLTTTKELVNSIALKSLFQTSSSLLKARMQELWRHSTSCRRHQQLRRQEDAGHQSGPGATCRLGP